MNFTLLLKRYTIYNPFFIFAFFLFMPGYLFPQNLPDIPAFKGKKIITVIKNRDSNLISESLSYARKASVLDTLEDNTIVSTWESAFQNNEGALIFNTQATRVQVAYQDRADYFFDSGKPVKLPALLDIYRSASDILVNKNVNKKITLEKEPDLYEIRALDTLRFSNLFFMQNIPAGLKSGANWIDSAKFPDITLIDTFVVKSIDRNQVTLYFKNKMAVDPKAYLKVSKQKADETAMSIFNLSNSTEGYLIFDSATLFICSIKGIITITAGSEANGVQRKWHTFSTKFSLINTVE